MKPFTGKWRPLVAPWDQVFRRDEHVADAAHRTDRLGMGGVGFDLAAQPGDAQVDGSIERVGLAVRGDLQ